MSVKLKMLTLNEYLLECNSTSNNHILSNEYLNANQTT